MTNDSEPDHYYVKATDSATGEQVGFAHLTLAAANAKAADLRMSRYRDVIISIREEPPETN